VVLSGRRWLDIDISRAFSSDLMSDVLAFSPEGTLLLTGLTNIQVVRTCEISGICAVLFVRGKTPDQQVIELAEQFNLPLLACNYSMFEASGRLFQSGVKGCR